MITSIDDFASRVADHAGITADRAEIAVRAVISGIGAYMNPAGREFLSEELPPALSGALHPGGGLGLPLEEQVLTPGMTTGQARELVASVCRVLAETLSVEALGRLRTALPPSVAPLLFAPEVAPPPLRHPVPHGGSSSDRS
jgi:uncharacterized protein (DUF2267 family)